MRLARDGTGSYRNDVIKAANLIGMAGLDELMALKQKRVTAAVNRVKLLSRIAIGKQYREWISEHKDDLIVKEVWQRIAASRSDEELEEWVRKRPLYLRSPEHRSRFTWIVRSNRWNPKGSVDSDGADCWLCNHADGDNSVHMLTECQDKDVIEWRAKVWDVCANQRQLLEWHDEMGDMPVLLSKAPEERRWQSCGTSCCALC